MALSLVFITQASVANLLHDLSHRGGAQIICVSHNAAFQGVCDGLVHVSRMADGSSMVEAPQQSSAQRQQQQEVAGARQQEKAPAPKIRRKR